MNRTFKTTLILTCMLAGFQSLAMSNEFSLETAKIGDQIVGKRDDGQFFAIKCGWSARLGLNGPYKKYSAEMAFPNSSGDIILQIKSGANEWETSRRAPLSDEAADAVCRNPYGFYTFKNEKSGIELSTTGRREIRGTPAGEQMTVGRDLMVRTGLVDNVSVDAVIAAATEDGHFFAIACSRGLINSSADLIYPNAAGKILVKEYNTINPFTFGPKMPAEKPTYLPLSKHAMNVICNNPNGLYELQVRADQQSYLELIRDHSFEANVRSATTYVRGF